MTTRRAHAQDIRRALVLRDIEQALMRTVKGRVVVAVLMEGGFPERWVVRVHEDVTEECERTMTMRPRTRKGKA